MNLSNVMWHIVEVANCCLEIWLISFYLNKMLTRRPDTAAFGRVWYVLSVVALALTNAVVPNEAVDKIHAPNGVTWLNIASLGVTVLSMVLFTLFSFKDSVLRRIFTDGIFVVVIFATENLLGVLLLVFLGEQMDQSAESGMGRLIGMVGTKVLSFWAIMLISKFSEKKYSEIKTSHWLMMILMPVISTSILAVIYRFQLDMLNRDNVGALVISAFVSITGLLYLNYATFSHIESFANEMRLVVLEEVLEREEKNYLLLNNAYNEMRTLRHDFRNQISVAYDLITHGETKAAEQYLDSLSGRITRYSYTGNMFIDSMLNMKQRFADEHKIAFQTKISLSHRIKLDSVDLCRILGNALDNALEECERMEAGERFVEVSISHDEDKLIMIITNSCAPNHNVSFRSRKKDKRHHGIGLMSIQKSVEHLGGLLQYGFQGELFTMTIVFREPEQKEKTS